ncbi:MAG TPA: SAM-dependent methyltransferase [Trebonia sp.]|nr:SAM-dependent methyltransferase [Trebonia sp.]
MHDFDPNTPSIARVYDYLLGGKDNFPADRGLADRFLAILPDIAPTMRDNRQFLSRAVTWAAGQGISQFIDLGCGLPTEPNTDGSARAVIPDARVVYVDRDPIVISHLNAQADTVPRVTIVPNDVGDVRAVLKAAGEALDLSRPACLVMGALVHFYPADAATDLVRRYVAALVPGSCLVLSCARVIGEQGQRLIETYNSGGTQIYPHSDEQIAAFFAGVELVEPGITEVRRWRADSPELPPLAPRVGEMIGGVGRVGRRKPAA